MSVSDFVDFVFMSGIARRATNQEKAQLFDHFSTMGYLTTDSDGNEVIRSSRFENAAEDMLDYMARLAEQYYFKTIS